MKRLGVSWLAIAFDFVASIVILIALPPIGFLMLCAALGVDAAALFLARPVSSFMLGGAVSLGSIFYVGVAVVFVQRFVRRIRPRPRPPGFLPPKG